jgi:BolA family transcriptional regulator, general stress-responsive regulator
MTAARVELIRERLTAALNPSSCEVIDESHKHAGHVGARDGRGHFRVHIVSDRFAGLNRIARHRLVYEALGELMTTDVHALSIEAIPPPI